MRAFYLKASKNVPRTGQLCIIFFNSFSRSIVKKSSANSWIFVSSYSQIPDFRYLEMNHHFVLQMSEICQKIFPDETIADVQQTWSLINSNLEVVGVEVLLRLFDKYPSYQSLFDTFKEVPLDQLKNKKEFLRHSLSVAKALNAAIENLDNSEKLVPLLTKVGKSHVKRNVTPEHFCNIQYVILEVIEQALKDKSTEQILSSWNEVLAVAISTIMKGASE